MNEVDRVGLEIRSYKNYKVLCEVLNEPVKTGASKKYQLENWSRYFTYEKKGNAFIIKDIKKIPDKKECNKGQSGIYVEYIDDIIMLLLSKDDNLTLDVSFGQLLEMTGLINPSFRTCWRNIHATSLATNIEEDYIVHFFNKEYPKVRDILKASLKRLKKNGFIDYEENRMLVVPIEYDIALDEKGKTIIDKKNMMPLVIKRELPARVATEKEREKILDLKFRVAESLGCKNEQGIIAKKLNKKYEKLLKEQLEVELNIDYYFTGLNIVKCRERITKYVDTNPLIKKLNEILIENHILSFKEESDKYNGQYWREDVRNNNCFLDTQIELLDYTVNVKNGYTLGNEVRRLENIIKSGLNKRK